MELTNIIDEKIRMNGPLSFCDFMELALYHPEHGYYSSGRQKIGPAGDFFTSCSLSPVFGYLLGRQLKDMWATLNVTEFSVVEYGAGTGELCRAILNYFRQETDLYNNLRYYIIEKSAAMRQLESELPGDKVTWLGSLSELGNFSGCVVANELVDNFAVHVVQMEETLCEVFVDSSASGLVEKLLPASPRLCNYFESLRLKLPRGYRTEVCLQAESWINEIGCWLERGYLLTIDYGQLSGELYDSSRNKGNLTCYYKHAPNRNFYENIGLQDITAHVNFSALGLFGMRKGFELAGYRNQGPFLEHLGFYEALAKHYTGNTLTNDLKQRRLTETLLLDMGEKFRVLCLRKNTPHTTLEGFKITNPEVLQSVA